VYTNGRCHFPSRSSFPRVRLAWMGEWRRFGVLSCILDMHRWAQSRIQRVDTRGLGEERSDGGWSWVCGYVTCRLQARGLIKLGGTVDVSWLGG
jgi:hypothetical protein